MSKAQFIFGLSSSLLLSGAGLSAWQANLIGPSLLLVGLGLFGVNCAAYIKVRSNKTTGPSLFGQNLISVSNQGGK